MSYTTLAHFYRPCGFTPSSRRLVAWTRPGHPEEAASSPSLRLAARELAGGRAGGAHLHVAPQRPRKTMAPRQLLIAALLASRCHAFFSSGRTCEIESCNT